MPQAIHSAGCRARHGS